jgi:hypothetical protein
LTVRNIEVNTAASLIRIPEKVEPELSGRRPQTSPSYWICSDALLRRMGSGMLTQYLQELGRPHIVSEIESWNIAVMWSSQGITSNGKSEAMRCEESEGVIVPMIAWTTQPCIGKDPYFDRVWNGGKCL